MLLQGLNSDAEQCLHAALRAAADELHCSILAAMLLSRVYTLHDQPANSAVWLDQSLARSRDVPEGAWIGAWPLLTKVYDLIARDQVDESEQALPQIAFLLSRHHELLSYHRSLAVAQGLLALARGNIDRAETVLHEALRERHSLYIEVYVAAVLALATIAHGRGQHEEARAQCWEMLAFCGERSLLQSYSAAALTLATWSTETEHM